MDKKTTFLTLKAVVLNLGNAKTFFRVRGSILRNRLNFEPALIFALMNFAGVEVLACQKQAQSSH
jgi:uncharacterized membrane protein